MKNKNALNFFFLYLLCSLASAQNLPEATIPDGPLIQKRAPDYASWTVTTAPADAKNEIYLNQIIKDNLKKDFVTYIKTEDILLIKKITETGETWDTWCKGTCEITLGPDISKWMVLNPNTDNSKPNFGYLDFSQTDFPDFNWISKSNYVDVKNFNNKSCLHFQDSFKVMSDDKEPTKFEAYIDLKTRMPVATIRGEEMITYEFISPPTIKLQFPAIIQKLFMEIKKEDNSGARRIPQ